MYANVGRPSIPPERLLKSSLLIALYSVRSERAFCEQLDYNLLFRWFLDMNLIEPSFDATTFTKNRERLLRHGVGQALFGEVVLEADRQGLLSDEHFTVDGTLIEATASLKSFNLGLPNRLALTKTRVSRVKRINRLRKESRLPAGGVVVTQMRRCVIALLLAASLPASYDEGCLELFDRFRGVALRHLSLFFPLGSCLPVRDAGAVVGVGLG